MIAGWAMADRDLFGNPVKSASSAANTARQLPLGLTVSVAQSEGCPSLRFSFFRSEGGNAMLQSTKALQDEQAAIGLRWAALLRRLYPAPNTAKKIAAAFQIDTRTAEAWLQGQYAPYAKFLLRAWRLHGFGAVAEVLAPDSAIAQAAPMQDALQDLETNLARLGDQLAQLRLDTAPKADRA